MKWVNAICTLMLALALLTGPAVAGDQRDLSNPSPRRAGPASRRAPPMEAGSSRPSVTPTTSSTATVPVSPPRSMEKRRTPRPWVGGRIYSSCCSACRSRSYP